MNKLEKIAVIVSAILLVAIVFVGFQVLNKKASLGNIFVESNAYSGAATYTSSTLTNSLAVSLVPRATSSRHYAKVCQGSTSTAIVRLYKQATSTGVVINQGYPLHPSSTPNGNFCMSIDANDPYTGQIWGIAPTTTTVEIEYRQE